MDRFDGFADPSCKLFKQLARKQDKAFFEAHKEEYKSQWEAPLHALLTELRAALDRAYPDCDLAPPKIFRIHRDVRFSADKSPYKTHIGGCLFVHLGKVSAMETPSPLYVQIGTETMTAAGMYRMTPPQLAKLRRAIVDDKRGAELEKLLAKIAKEGFEIDRSEALKRVPAGFDPEHPRADLLKLKGVPIMFPPYERELLGSRAFFDHLLDRAKRVAPIVRWLTFACAT